MSLLQNIIKYIEQKRANYELFDDIENLNEVLLEKRIEIFKEKVTPKFAEIGLNNWNGKYIWFSDFNEQGIKHVIEYNVFKGFGGSFSYGNCFDFIPTISNKKFTNHKTNKSTKILFFNRLESWQKSYERNSRINPDRISTVNENKFITSLDKVLKNNLPKLKNWFVENETIDQNIDSLILLTKNSPYEIGQRIISYEYLLAFFFAHQNNFREAEKWMQMHFNKELNDESEIKLIMEKLNSISKK